MNDPKEIGRRIKERRKLLGMTQKDLAEKIGYKDCSAITKIEAGSNSFKRSKAEAFAKALGCSSNYLLGLEEYASEEDRDFIIDLNANNGLVAVGKRFLDFKNVADYMDEVTYRMWIEIGKILIK